MSITALEIQEVRFGEVKKGYDPNEVDEVLERVATDVDTLNRALNEAAVRIKAAEKRVEEAEKRAEEADKRAKQAAVSPASEQPKPEKSGDSYSEEMIAKAFMAAQKSADALQDEARKEAEKVYREAEAKGRDIVREALGEKQKTLAEVDRLRESSEQFRTEYLSLLKHFQADAQKRFSAFEDVQPPGPSPEQRKQAQENLLAANDASSPAPALAPAPAPVPVPTAAPAPAGSAKVADKAPALTPPLQAPSPYASLDDDDDLDIEEID
jgi:DivIVA domain-containing protein